MGRLIGSLVGGFLSKKSGKKQAKRLAEAGEAALEPLAPFQEGGAEANRTLLGALGIGDAGASDEALNRFLESSGFRSSLEAGSRAITGNQAAAGLLGSGSTLKRLTGFGQDLARQGFGDFVTNLQNVANRGLGAAGQASASISGVGQAAAEARARGEAGFSAGLGGAFETISQEAEKPASQISGVLGGAGGEGLGKAALSFFA